MLSPAPGTGTLTQQETPVQQDTPAPQPPSTCPRPNWGPQEMEGCPASSGSTLSLGPAFFRGPVCSDLSVYSLSGQLELGGTDSGCGAGALRPDTDHVPFASCPGARPPRPPWDAPTPCSIRHPAVRWPRAGLQPQRGSPTSRSPPLTWASLLDTRPPPWPRRGRPLL